MLYPYFLRKGDVDIEKKFDKEYQTQWSLEFLYLKECGIPYTFIKTDNGITTWKYRKDYRLFDALKNFYKNQ